MTKSSINWKKYEDSLWDSIVRNEYLLARSKVIYEVEKEISKHKSINAYNAFKSFLKDVDKLFLMESEELSMIKSFKVIDHL